CSTGGRQGLSEAQRYPADFNGVLAGAPAIDWTKFIVEQLWPQMVMMWNNDELPACKEAAVQNALAARCPDQDGQIDGVFDARNCDDIGILQSLVGTSTPCGTITQLDVDTIKAIWQGMRKSGSQSD